MMSMMMSSWMEGDPVQTIAAGGMFMFLSVLMICVFSFISIAVWTEARRKEREAYYKAETVRRLTETAANGAQAVIEIMREEARIEEMRTLAADVKKLEGLEIGAVVNIFIGVALYVFLRSIGGPGMVGAFPFAVGIALAVYAYVLSDKRVSPM